MIEMKMNDFEKLPRDVNGRIIMDSLVEGRDYKIMLEKKGKRSKEWVVLEDGKFLKKMVNSESYEDYAELLVEELCKQIGLETAHYDMAIKNGVNFVISYDFLKNKTDRLISGELFLASGVSSFEGMIACSRRNTDELGQKRLNNLKTAEKILLSRVPKDDARKIMAFLDMLFCFSSFCFDSDLHLANWSLIYNVETKKYRPAPNYDGGSYFRLNLRAKNVQSAVNVLTRTSTLQKSKRLLDEGKVFPRLLRPQNLLNYSFECTDVEGMDRVEWAFHSEPERFGPCLELLNKMDVYEAISSVQTRINASIPDAAIDLVILLSDVSRDRLSFLMNSFGSESLERGGIYV